MMRSSAFVGDFAAAVEEVGDVRIFFGLGHAELGFTGGGDDFAEQFIHGLRGEQGLHEGGERVAIGGHAYGGNEFGVLLARETVEGWV